MLDIGFLLLHWYCSVNFHFVICFCRCYVFVLQMLFMCLPQLRSPFPLNAYTYVLHCMLWSAQEKTVHLLWCWSSVPFQNQKCPYEWRMRNTAKLVDLSGDCAFRCATGTGIREGRRWWTLLRFSANNLHSESTVHVHQYTAFDIHHIEWTIYRLEMWVV